MTTKTDTEQERAELLPCPFCGCAMSLSAVARDWWRITGGHNEDCILYDHRHDAPQTDYQKQALIEDWNRRAALQSQDREDALIEVMLEACDEWSQYVEVDTAPRTLREHVQLAIDHARRIEGEGE